MKGCRFLAAILNETTQKVAAVISMDTVAVSLATGRSTVFPQSMAEKLENCIQQQNTQLKGGWATPFFCVSRL